MRPRWRGPPDRDQSPWKPITTILVVILMIAFMPYMGPVPQRVVVYKRRSLSFPLVPLLLIPVVIFLLAQWLSGGGTGAAPWHPLAYPPSSRRVYPSSSFGRSSSSYPWESSSRRPLFNPRDPMMEWQHMQRQSRRWPWTSRPFAEPPTAYGRWGWSSSQTDTWCRAATTRTDAAAASGVLSWTFMVTGYSSCWALRYLRWWVQFESSVLHCTKRTTSFASKNTHPLSPLSFLFAAKYTLWQTPSQRHDLRRANPKSDPKSVGTHSSTNSCTHNLERSIAVKLCDIATFTQSLLKVMNISAKGCTKKEMTAFDGSRSGHETFLPIVRAFYQVTNSMVSNLLKSLFY